MFFNISKRKRSHTGLVRSSPYIGVGARAHIPEAEADKCDFNE